MPTPSETSPRHRDRRGTDAQTGRHDSNTPLHHPGSSHFGGDARGVPNRMDRGRRGSVIPGTGGQSPRAMAKLQASFRRRPSMGAVDVASKMHRFLQKRASVFVNAFDEDAESITARVQDEVGRPGDADSASWAGGSTLASGMTTRDPGSVVASQATHPLRTSFADPQSVRLSADPQEDDDDEGSGAPVTKGACISTGKLSEQGTAPVSGLTLCPPTAPQVPLDEEMGGLQPPELLTPPGLRLQEIGDASLQLQSSAVQPLLRRHESGTPPPALRHRDHSGPNTPKTQTPKGKDSCRSPRRFNFGGSFCHAISRDGERDADPE